LLPDKVTITGHRYSGSGMEPVDITVCAEYHVAIMINGRPCVTIACSGSDLELLAAGHLASEGIICSQNEIARVEVDEKALTVNVVTAPGAEVFGRLMNVRTLVSGCAGAGPSAVCAVPAAGVPCRIEARMIISMMKEFLGLSDTYRLTHGVHSAALYDAGGERVAFFDEIGRHNAVDKLIGLTLARGMATERMILLTTGRVSSEIVSKAALACIPGIVTRAAPTSMAVDMAREMNIILVTGVRGRGFFVHHGAEYIE
jgi:FdhD protein